MMRYFFDIRDNGGLYPDEEGLEFATQREAEVEAVSSLAGLARNLAPAAVRPDIAIEVRTVSGRVFQVAIVFETNNTKQ